MASRLNSELSDLDYASQRTAEVTDEIRNGTGAIMASLTTLEANFEGVAAEALSQYRAVATKETTVITDKLGDIAEALKTTREQYEETDSANASNITGQGSLTDLLRGATNDTAGVSDALNTGQTNATIQTAGNDGDDTDGISAEDAPPEALANHDAVIAADKMAEKYSGYENDPLIGLWGKRNRAEWAARNPLEFRLVQSEIQPEVDRVGRDWVGPEGKGWQNQDEDHPDLQLGEPIPGHEGKSNAFRHALLVASMTSQGIDPESAIDLGVAHELDGDTPGEEWGTHDSYSDLVNNQAGAEIGVAYQGLTTEQLAPIVAGIVENEGENPFGTDLDLTSPKG